MGGAPNYGTDRTDRIRNWTKKSRGTVEVLERVRFWQKKVHLSANLRGGVKDIPRVLTSTEIITVVVFTAGQRLVL